jgi:hypothetical protein
MAAPVFGATDVLGLGSDWEPQSSTGAQAATRTTASGDDGDIVAENQSGETQSGSASYIYIGAETGFIAAITAAAAWPGRLVATDTLLVTKVGIDYSPCAEGKRPLVTFDVRDGPTAAPASPYQWLTALTLPTYVAANKIVPPILSATAGDAEIQTSMWALQCQFAPELDKDGDYLAGEPYAGEETIDMTWVGVPTSITSTGWIQTNGVATALASTSNTAYPTYSYSFIRKVARSAVS